MIQGFSLQNRMRNCLCRGGCAPPRDCNGAARRCAAVTHTRVARSDVAVALLVVCLGTAIVVGVALSTRATDAASAQALVTAEATQLAERVKLIFEPAAAILRAAAAACAVMNLDLASWTVFSAPLAKVRGIDT